MSEYDKTIIIELLAKADPDNLEKIPKVVETLCEGMSDDSYKTDIVKALANAPTAKLEKIPKVVETLVRECLMIPIKLTLYNH